MASTDPEERRLAGLDTLQSDPFARTAFDDLTRVAADAFGVPMSSITIMDADGHWSSSSVGMPAGGMPGTTAFGALALETPNGLTIVEDAMLDPRFSDGRLAGSGLRFYVAAPLTLSTGQSVGVLCVQDTEPHRVDPQKLQRLKFMADQVVATLEARIAARNFPARDNGGPPKL